MRTHFFRSTTYELIFSILSRNSTHFFDWSWFYKFHVNTHECLKWLLATFHFVWIWSVGWWILCHFKVRLFLPFLQTKQWKHHHTTDLFQTKINFFSKFNERVFLTNLAFLAAHSLITNESIFWRLLILTLNQKKYFAENLSHITWFEEQFTRKHGMHLSVLYVY